MTLTFFNYAGITVTAILALILFFMILNQKRTRLEIEKKANLEKQRLYQISILKEIQDKIGYSLDVEKIIDVITGSLKTSPTLFNCLINDYQGKQNSL